MTLAAPAALLAGLAQAPGLIDRGPLWSRWLFEQPWPLIAAVVAASAAIAWRRNARGRGASAAVVMAAGVACAGAAYVTSRVVQTERESLVARTRALVDAVVGADAAALRATLGRSVALRLGAAAGIAGGLGGAAVEPERLVEQVTAQMSGPYRLIEHRTRWARADTDARRAPGAVRADGLSQVRVWADPAQSRVPVSSTWLLTWERLPGRSGQERWALRGIELQSLDAFSTGW
ncbi:MAG: hypothetical protein C0468_00900 [Planctomyces sp.]|nr:hypothetical protein [Planctomyces sp.]MBA4119846.1 hypothetical protein [Isosphaera sp.]